MSWVFLLLAGLVEVAWSQSIKPTESFTRVWPTVICAVLATGSVYLLTHAMRELPVGTAYAVFTGIGAVGAIALGIFLYHDPVTPGRFLALGLIVSGVVTARFVGSP